MSNYEATKYDFDGANLTGIEGIPTATIVPWSSASVPSGFLECNGQTVSRSTYAALFAIVGTTYGAGDGSSTFGLPDLQDNVPVGKSNNKSLAHARAACTNCWYDLKSECRRMMRNGEINTPHWPSLPCPALRAGTA